MKVVLLGATGWIGGFICSELLARGHEVTAIVRDESRLRKSHENLTVKVGDIEDVEGLGPKVHGHEAVIASVSGRRMEKPEFILEAAGILLRTLERAGMNRLLWIGGAGSLEVAPGIPLVDTEEFPAEWKEEARMQCQALKLFRASESSVNWTFISPAMRIQTHERRGQYRVGQDSLLIDETGESQIAVGDLAIAVVDELESAAHPRKRFTVAY